MKRKEWTKEEEAILITNYPLKGSKECESILKRNRPSIMHKVARLGIQRIYVPKIDMEKLFTPEFAYCLGFLWADGHIVKKKPIVALGIQRRDEEDIFKIFSSIGNWHVKQSCVRGYQKTTFQIYDKQFHKFLTDYGFQTKSLKSSNKILKLLGPELSKDFLYGLFDGDGSLSKSRYHLKITSDKKCDWNDLVQYFSSELKFNFITRPREHDSIIDLTGEQNIVDFYLECVRNSHFGLLRKKKIFLSLFSDTVQKLKSKKFAYKSGCQYRARISYNKELINLGSFSTKGEARNASLKEHRRMNSLFYQTFCNMQTVLGKDLDINYEDLFDPY